MRVWVATGMAAILILGGCASKNIRPIPPRLAEHAHDAGSDARGYIVYAPVMVVEVSAQEVCAARDEKGRCSMRTQCVAGKPFLLPDYSKPYLVDGHAGLGSAGLDVSIADGWRLDSLKDSSDNGDLIGLVQRLATRGDSPGVGPAAGGCRSAGLYRVSVDGESVKLTPMLVY